MTPDAKQFEEFKRVIRRVLQSPRSDFYRDKYQREGFNPSRDLEHVADIPRVPRLTREELAATSPFERLFSEPNDVRVVRYTSGTTRSPLMLIFRGEYAYGIPGKRPLILFQSSQVDAYYAALPRVAALPYFPPLVGSPASYAISAALATMYRTDAVIGIPSRILALAAELAPAARSAVEKVFIVGERVTPAIRDDLKTQFPNATLDLRYGMTEFGCPGYQCGMLRAQSDIRYHCSPEYLLEVTDPSSGLWQKIGDEGEVVLTDLRETPHQLIRYRTGDAARIVATEPCVCGALAAFEVTGRVDADVIKIAGGILRTDEIERVLGELAETEGADFRAVVRTAGGRPVLTLDIALGARAAGHPAVAQALREAIAERLFLTSTKTLADFLKEGTFGGLEIQFVSRFPHEMKAQRLRIEVIP